MAETKQQRWNRKHPEAMKIARERSSAKHFIKNYATEQDLETLKQLMAERMDHLDDLVAQAYEKRSRRLKGVYDVIRRHSGPEAENSWRWGSQNPNFSASDVQSVAEVYPYIYQGQYYAVALFDERVCVGLPQYARFRPNAQQVWDLPMPWYYNKIFKREDWPAVRALLAAKYNFHEIIRVRYLPDVFVERVGHEYFYPISERPMMTEDPDNPGEFSFDDDTKSRMVKAVSKAQPETKDRLPELVTYLESTIEKAVWDKLPTKKQAAFQPITDQTTYAGGTYPLKEVIAMIPQR
ncbi:hypothetical protein [Lacticaseibacillus paracasei]|uniref:hypothetical protein n=1 Tax=Lacticaseibacillus paracasei TaxID=1597 RepID=UPI00189AC842|nr:hypothetical protein [Lacticaseibacillus paracasei]